MLIFRSVGVNALSDAVRCIHTTLHRRWSLCLASCRRTRVSSMSLSATFVLSSTVITCPVITFPSAWIVFPSPTLLRRGIDRYLTFLEFHKTKLQYSFYKAVVPSIFTRPPYTQILCHTRTVPSHYTPHIPTSKVQLLRQWWHAKRSSGFLGFTLRVARLSGRRVVCISRAVSPRSATPRNGPRLTVDTTLTVPRALPLCEAA